MEQVLEEASKLCCAECGHWNDWQYADQTKPTRVTTAAVRGWVLTLCDDCRAKANAE
jgi:hypothetical protein